MTREEMWSNIEKLSELRSKYSYFDEKEQPFYHALSLGIKGIKALEQESKTDSWSIKDVADTFKKHGLIKEQEPCEDAISRVETVKFLANHSNEFEDVKIRMAFLVASSLVNNLHNLPPVNPQLKTGHWIDDEFGSKCSCCGIHTHLDKFDRPMKFKHCSMCGAKMIEPQESEGKE